MSRTRRLLAGLAASLLLGLAGAIPASAQESFVCVRYPAVAGCRISLSATVSPSPVAGVPVTFTVTAQRVPTAVPTDSFTYRYYCSDAAILGTSDSLGHPIVLDTAFPLLVMAGSPDSSSTGTSPGTGSCTYAAAGTYDAVITAQLPGRALVGIVKQVTVAAAASPLTVSLTGTAGTATFPTSLTATVSTVTFPGPLVSYVLTCDTNNPTTQSGSVPATATTLNIPLTCTYPQSGSYPAKIDITQGARAGSATATVSVVDLLQITSFTTSSSNVTVGGGATLNGQATSTDASATLHYQFDCGNGILPPPQDRRVGTSPSGVSCPYASATGSPFHAKLTVSQVGGGPAPVSSVLDITVGGAAAGSSARFCNGE